MKAHSNIRRLTTLTSFLKWARNIGCFPRRNFSEKTPLFSRLWNGGPFSDKRLFSSLLTSLISNKQIDLYLFYRLIRFWSLIRPLVGVPPAMGWLFVLGNPHKLIIGIELRVERVATRTSAPRAPGRDSSIPRVVTDASFECPSTRKGYRQSRRDNNATSLYSSMLRINAVCTF